MNLRVILAWTMLASCAQSAKAPQTPPPPEPLTLTAAGIDETRLDPTVDVCADFRRYACGQSTASSEEGLRAAARSAVEQRLVAQSGSAPGRFYAACLAHTPTEGAPVAIRELVARIAEVRNRTDLAEIVGELHDLGIWPYFRLDVVLDPNNPDITLAAVRPPTGEATGDIRRVDRAGLAGLAPTFDWAAYFRARGQPDLDGILATPEQIRAIGRGARTPLAEHRVELSALVAASVPKRDQSCLDATFDAFGPNLLGDNPIAADLATDIEALADVITPDVQVLVGGPGPGEPLMFPVGDDHVANALSARRAASRAELANVGQRPPAQWPTRPHPLEAEVAFDSDANRLVVTRPALASPRYQSDASAPVRWGQLGALIGPPMLSTSETPMADSVRHAATVWRAAGDPPTNAAGATDAQLVFLAFAQARCEVADLSARFAALEEFRQAFECTAKASPITSP